MCIAHQDDLLAPPKRNRHWNFGRISWKTLHTSPAVFLRLTVFKGFGHNFFFFFSFPSLSTPVLSVTLPLIVNTKIPAYRETWWGCVCLLAYSDIVGKFFLLRLITQSSKGHLVRFFLSNSTSHKPRRIVYSSRRRFLIFLFSYTKEFFKGFTQCCQ